MRRLLLVAGILSGITNAPPVGAETLYRCVARNGAVSYQSQACPETQRLDRIVEYRSDPVRARDTEQPVESKRQRTRQTTRSPGQHAARGSHAVTTGSRCRASKAKREAALQRIGLSRTYEQLSRLDAPVREACRGF